MKKIKICGLTRREDAEYLNEAEVDYAGFVLFFEKSKRNVSIEEAEKIRSFLHPGIKSTAVVVSPDKEQLKAIEKSGFSIVQIHGTIDKDNLKEIGIPVWRALSVNLSEKEKLLKEIEKLDDYPYEAVVMDGYQSGSGEVFDWEEIQKYTDLIRRKGRKLVLAGGLTSENVKEGIKALDPDIVDVSSGVEESREKRGKNREKILAFRQAVSLCE